MNPVQAIPPASPPPRNRAKTNTSTDDPRFDLAMGHAAAAHARSHVSTTPRPERDLASNENQAEERAPIESVERHSPQEGGGSAPAPVRPGLLAFPLPACFFFVFAHAVVLFLKLPLCRENRKPGDLSK